MFVGSGPASCSESLGIRARGSGAEGFLTSGCGIGSWAFKLIEFASRPLGGHANTDRLGGAPSLGNFSKKKPGAAQPVATKPLRSRSILRHSRHIVGFRVSGFRV